LIAETFRVSASGQMSLPAPVRRRWNLDGGGPVEVIDLGFGVLIVPAGRATLLLDEILPRYDLKLWIGHLFEGAAYLPR